MTIKSSAPLFGALALATVLLTVTGCARRPEAAAASSLPTAATTATPGTTHQSASAVVPGSAEDFRINVADRVYFDLDSHVIRADARPRLDAQAAWLRRYPDVRVLIEGNADERGTREYNLALGARRAEAVRSYLVAAGVAPARIDVISYGKERPIAFGSDESSHAQNRNALTGVTGGR
jgi:peptidoglycan-associated lipoprotein